VGRKLGIPVSQIYVQIQTEDSIFKPYTYVIDPVYLSEHDQEELREDGPSNFAESHSASQSKRQLQVGPISIPRVFIEAAQRRPYDEWKDVTHHNLNYSVLVNMIRESDTPIILEVLALS